MRQIRFQSEGHVVSKLLSVAGVSAIVCIFHKPIKKWPALVRYIPCGREAAAESIGYKGKAFNQNFQEIWQKKYINKSKQQSFTAYCLIISGKVVPLHRFTHTEPASQDVGAAIGRKHYILKCVADALFLTINISFCMDIYKILKYYRRIDSPRLKLLGIMGLHLLHRRYLYVALDPSLACNLRCRLCYFSNQEKVKEMGGRFSEEDITAIQKSVFHRCLKLQIGDGAEPTTYPGLLELVKKAREKNIPTISISTNGNLLTQEKLRQLVENGLNELILSTHGMSRQVYEYMMRNARFDHFTQLLQDISEIRKEHPGLKVRVNFTMCEDNIDDLKLLPQVFSSMKPDVIQLRPVQDIGSSIYKNYSIDPIFDKYDETVGVVIRFCQENNITCLFPQKGNLEVIQHDNDRQEHFNSSIDMLPYFHLSPHEAWKTEFNPYEENFEQYARRTHRVRKMLKMLLGHSAGDEEGVTRAMNYRVG